MILIHLGVVDIPYMVLVAGGSTVLIFLVQMLLEFTRLFLEIKKNIFSISIEIKRLGNGNSPGNWPRIAPLN